jgi:hypothetical protein
MSSTTIISIVQLLVPPTQQTGWQQIKAIGRGAKSVPVVALSSCGQQPKGRDEEDRNDNNHTTERKMYGGGLGGAPTVSRITFNKHDKDKSGFISKSEFQDLV